MVARSITLVLCIIILFSCDSLSPKDRQMENKTNPTDSLIIKTVLSYDKVYSSTPNCDNWKSPESSQLASIFAEMREISGNNWHNCYGDWSCGSSGYVEISEEKYYFRLDAGGWITLVKDDMQRYFGCENQKDCWSLFPSEQMCDSSGNFIEDEN